MSRMNEYVFELNNEMYQLTFDTKPVLLKNGKKQKILTILTAYITKNNLPISLLNSKGNKENTNSLAKKVLDYFLDSDSANKINITSNLRKMDKNQINIKSVSKIKNNFDETKQEELILSKNFKVVMICAKDKAESFFTKYPDDKFVNQPLNNLLKHHPDDNNVGENMTWREYLESNQKDRNLLSAYQLYIKPEYMMLHIAFSESFYILSAGWGLVNSEYKLPKYDITFKTKAPIINKRAKNLFAQPIYHDFNHLVNFEGDEDIVFLGSPDYIPLFIHLTQNLKNRKIIYKRKGIPNNVNYQLPNNSFVYRYYNTARRTTWYYNVANDLCNGIIP